MLYQREILSGEILILVYHRSCVIIECKLEEWLQNGNNYRGTIKTSNIKEKIVHFETIQAYGTL